MTYFPLRHHRSSLFDVIFSSPVKPILDSVIPVPQYSVFKNNTFSSVMEPYPAPPLTNSSFSLHSCLVLLGGSGDDEEHGEGHTEEHKRKRQVAENIL